MMLFSIIAFSFLAFISFIGIIAEKDTFSRKCMTVCFGICAALVLAVNILGGVL